MLKKKKKSVTLLYYLKNTFIILFTYQGKVF